ncbi:MAG: hypothetical protein J0L57_17665 [Burkholderiales bacterium]|nr:hypothetical protein [Burkholderiales bacterium]
MELELEVRRPIAGAAATGREDGGERCWRDLVAQIGGEVAAPIEAALERLTAAATTGRLDRAGLQVLRDDVDKARRVALAARQLSRFGAGRLQLQPQRCQLAQVVRDALAQRSREGAWSGIGLHQDLRPAEVVTDAALLHALLHALLDWCVEHARSRLEFAVDVRGYYQKQCRQRYSRKMEP